MLFGRFLGVMSHRLEACSKPSVRKERWLEHPLVCEGPRQPHYKHPSARVQSSHACPLLLLTTCYILLTTTYYPLPAAYLSLSVCPFCLFAWLTSYGRFATICFLVRLSPESPLSVGRPDARPTAGLRLSPPVCLSSACPSVCLLSGTAGICFPAHPAHNIVQ